MSIKRVLIFYHTTELVHLSTQICWRGGLNCEAKVQVIVVTPSLLFFLEVGRKKGGVTAGQYGTIV